MSRTFKVLVLFVAATVSACKTTKSEEKLFGGKLAKKGEFPATVALTQVQNLDLLGSRTTPEAYAFKAGCTASFIHKNFVLTAAHCVVKPGVKDDNSSESRFMHHAVQPNEWTHFFTGLELDRTKEGRDFPDTSEFLSRRVKDIYVHPSVLEVGAVLHMKGIRNILDLAVIELEPRTEPTSIAGFAKVDIQKGLEFLYGGYGCEDRPVEMKRSSRAESEAFKLDATSDDNVTDGLKSRLKMTSSNVYEVFGGRTAEGGVYTSVKDVNQSGCPGDSGGPVYVISNGQKEIIGVNSYGRTVGEESVKKPVEIGFAIVTEGSEGFNWIQDIMLDRNDLRKTSTLSNLGKGIDLGLCEGSGPVYSKLTCGNDMTGLVSNCLEVHSKRKFADRLALSRECRDLKSLRYEFNKDRSLGAKKSGVEFFTATSESKFFSPVCVSGKLGNPADLVTELNKSNSALRTEVVKYLLGSKSFQDEKAVVIKEIGEVIEGNLTTIKVTYVSNHGGQSSRGSAPSQGPGAPNTGAPSVQEKSLFREFPVCGVDYGI